MRKWGDPFHDTPWNRTRQLGLRSMDMEEKGESGTRNLQRMDERSRRGQRDRPMSPDGILTALADQHRRAVLGSLMEASEKTLEYDTLVDRVAEVVQDEDMVRPSDDHGQRVRNALHHTHLPKLEDAGIIDYRAETAHVQYVGGELEQNLLSLVESPDGTE